MGKGAMDAAELNNYPGGTMGESRRRRSWMSSSLTLPKAPSPQSRRRRRQPASLPLPAKKGIPALALPLCCVFTDTGSRLKHANAPAALRSRGHVARAWLLRHPVPQAPPERGGTGAGRGGRGAQAVAPQVRTAVSPPRAASRRSPQPSARRAGRPPGP